MTTGDWLGLCCLSALVGFFSGGFFVYRLFFRKEKEESEELEEDDVGDPESEE